MNQINYYASIRKPSVLAAKNVSEWFSLIKESHFSQSIQQARQGKLDYNETKLELPCVTYNFLFNKYKADKNIIAGTGLLYIDIDSPGFNPDSLNKSKLLACYKSFGGAGYALIVRVNGLTKDNFKAMYGYICKDLGIENVIDIHAAKASQFSVLSFDPNIYINPNSFVYSCESVPHSVVIKEEEKKNTYTLDGGTVFETIRYNNLDEFNFEGNYTVFKQGVYIVTCFIPLRRIAIGKRKHSLLSYVNNLVWLNPNVSYKRILHTAGAVNDLAFDKPLTEKEVRDVVNSILKYKEQGTLKPIYFRKKRKIIFKKNSALSREEKMEIVRAEVAELKKDSSREKIHEILEDWDFEELGKISIRKISDNNPISKKTVAKYYGEFKEYIEELNKIHLGKQKQ